MRTWVWGHPVLWWSLVLGFGGLFAFVCAGVGYLWAEWRLGVLGSMSAAFPARCCCDSTITRRACAMVATEERVLSPIEERIAMSDQLERAASGWEAEAQVAEGQGLRAAMWGGKPALPYSADRSLQARFEWGLRDGRVIMQLQDVDRQPSPYSAGDSRRDV